MSGEEEHREVTVPLQLNALQVQGPSEVRISDNPESPKPPGALHKDVWAPWQLWAHRVEKAREGMYAVEDAIGDGNFGTLHGGLLELVKLLVGESKNTFGGPGRGGIGVGDGDTHFERWQTGLLGKNTFYKELDQQFPRVSQVSNDSEQAVWQAQVIWQATFGPEEANFAWNETSIVSLGGPEKVHLDRSVYPFGVKKPGETWTLWIRLKWVRAEMPPDKPRKADGIYRFGVKKGPYLGGI